VAFSTSRISEPVAQADGENDDRDDRGEDDQREQQRSAHFGRRDDATPLVTWLKEPLRALRLLDS
jgi:hypothetical protein